MGGHPADDAGSTASSEAAATMTRTSILWLCLVFALPQTARAQTCEGSAGPSVDALDELPEPSTDLPPGRVGEFWREAHFPGSRRARTLLRQGLRQLAVAMAEEASERRRGRLMRRARAALRQAHLCARRDPEPLYFYALSVSQSPLPGAGRARTRELDRAVMLFERLRALDPGYEAQSVAFEMGLIRGRRGELEQAIAEYRRSIATAFDERTTVSAHGNMAEDMMLVGDLSGALAHYLRAAELARAAGGAGVGLALAYWGAAIASDRLGEGYAALEYAERAMSAAGGSMAPLRSQGVFFMPANELHWYEALGHLANAARETDPEPHTDHLRYALRSFERYLEEADEERPWDRIARRHVEEIRAELERPATGRRRR